MNKTFIKKMRANFGTKLKDFFQKKESLINDLNIPWYKYNINIRIKKTRGFNFIFEIKKFNLENLNYLENEILEKKNNYFSKIISYLDSYKEKKKML